MAKYYGGIGYFLPQSKPVNGVCRERMVERSYFGDVLSNFYKTRPGENVNDDIEISNKISVISDDFSLSNYGYMRYIRWNGASWKITSVEVAFPRLILTIGGIYNGDTAEASGTA